MKDVKPICVFSQNDPVPTWHSLSIFKLRRVVLICDTPHLAV